MVLFIYVIRLASKEIFSPSNKIHREVGRAKDLSVPMYNSAKLQGVQSQEDRHIHDYHRESMPIMFVWVVCLGAV